MQILNTKFHIPAPDQGTLVQREALLKFMSDADGKGLVLIQAPAGFGKTTFLTQWITTKKRRAETAWISLEKRDNTWVVFWSCVIMAFQKIDPHVCDPTKQLLEAGQIAKQEDLLITLINGLEKSNHKFILALDDYHLISDRLVHDGINFLIDHPIDNLLIIIATRNAPPLGLARLRISGRLKEIDETQLRFSRKETIDLIACFFPAPMTDAALDILTQQTEGWVAALKLAMISFKENKKFSLGPGPGKDRFIQDYLMEEVFSQLPLSIQVLMTRISILDRFNLPLATALSNNDAVTGPGQSPELCPGQSPIEFMQRHHLFLIPLDDTGQWFRFHHLFQHFLKKELKKQGAKNLLLLHHNAFQWFEAHNFFEEAFSHGLEAGREDLAARTLATHISSLYGNGGEQALIPFFNQLSFDIIQTIPILACHYYAIKIFNGQFEVIDRMRPLVELAKTKEDHRLLTGFYMVFLGYDSFYRTGDLEDAIEKCLLALELIPTFHGAMRQMMEFMLTLSYRLLGKIEPARRLSCPRETDNLLMSALGTMNRSLLEMELGNLAVAKKRIQTEIQAIELSFGIHIPSLYGFVFIIMAIIFKEENLMEPAGTFFSKGISIIKKTGFPELIIISHGEYAVFLSDIKDFNGAHRAVDHAIAIARQSFSWIERLLLAQKRYIWLREKKLDLVRPWAESCLIEEGMEIPFQNSPEYLILARYQMEKGQWEKVFWILDPMIRADKRDLRNRRLMECLVLKAKALILSGRTPRAMDFLIQAMELSRNQKYVHLFVNEMSGMEKVYQSLNASQGLPPLLLFAMKNYLNPSHKPLSSRQVRVQNFEEDFNARELDILKLFQQGVSNKEAANTLNLSVNTVRWYASRLFAKLSVKRRGQAVTEAVRLGLI
jgi:LuxR family maltose regulon positive regulatory protein